MLKSNAIHLARHLGRACGISPGPKQNEKNPPKKTLFRREGKHHNSPTAAFRLEVHRISANIRNMLRPQTMTSAMLPRDLLVESGPICPTRGIPHSGLTPTGAVVALDEVALKVEGELC